MIHENSNWNDIWWKLIALHSTVHPAATDALVTWSPEHLWLQGGQPCYEVHVSGDLWYQYEASWFNLSVSWYQIKILYGSNTTKIMIKHYMLITNKTWGQCISMQGINPYTTGSYCFFFKISMSITIIAIFLPELTPFNFGRHCGCWWPGALASGHQ